eukprot:1216380-Prymnesium_polylepis.1
MSEPLTLTEMPACPTAGDRPVTTGGAAYSKKRPTELANPRARSCTRTSTVPMGCLGVRPQTRVSVALTAVHGTLPRSMEGTPPLCSRRPLTQMRSPPIEEPTAGRTPLTCAVSASASSLVVISPAAGAVAAAVRQRSEVAVDHRTSHWPRAVVPSPRLISCTLTAAAEVGKPLPSMRSSVPPAVLPLRCSEGSAASVSSTDGSGSVYACISTIAPETLSVPWSVRSDSDVANPSGAMVRMAGDGSAEQ